MRTASDPTEPRRTTRRASTSSAPARDSRGEHHERLPVPRLQARRHRRRIRRRRPACGRCKCAEAHQGHHRRPRVRHDSGDAAGDAERVFPCPRMQRLPVDPRELRREHALRDRRRAGQLREVPRGCFQGRHPPLRLLPTLRPDPDPAAARRGRQLKSDQPMNNGTSRCIRALSCMASAALCVLAGVAGADESEIFVGTGNAVSSQRPNILFIMDTSGSMDEDVVTQVPFDPAVVFPGNSNCNGRIFYAQGSSSSTPPSCNDSNSVPAANFKCDAGAQTMAVSGFYVAAQGAQYRADSAGVKRWRNINGSNAADAWVECRADSGVHGGGVDMTRLWASNSDRPWADTAGEEMGWNTNGAGGGYVFYTGNYINWLNSGGTIIQKRIEIMQIVAKQTIDQLAVSDSVNLGLMRFSNNTTSQCSNSSAEGGMVIQEMGPVAANAAEMKTKIDTLDDGAQPDGCTPLSET